MNDVASRVVRERKIRYGSARAAATAGEISNTLWSRFEKDGNVTPTVREGVARAFGWPNSWPEELPGEAPPVNQPDDELAGLVSELARSVEDVLADAIDQRQKLAALESRLAALEGRSGRRSAD